MIIRIIQAVLVAMFLSILGYLLGRLVGSALQSRLEEKANLKVVRDTVLRRAKLERSLEARVRSRRTDLRQIDNRIKELVRQRLELEGQLREATAVGDRILRVIGEEVVGKPHFLALVYNKYIAGGGGAAGDGPGWDSVGFSDSSMTHPYGAISPGTIRQNTGVGKMKRKTPRYLLSNG